MNRKRQIMLHQNITDCKDELKVLEKAREAISLAINTSYMYGADIEFLELIDKANLAIFERIADVQDIKAACHRKLEQTGQLARSLALA
jgi:hypothetical protein